LRQHHDVLLGSLNIFSFSIAKHCSGLLDKTGILCVTVTSGGSLTGLAEYFWTFHGALSKPLFHRFYCHFPPFCTTWHHLMISFSSHSWHPVGTHKLTVFSTPDTCTSCLLKHSFD